MVRSSRITIKKGQQKRAKNESPIVEEKADSMGAKIEDDTQAKKEEIETEPPEKKIKVSNSQDEAGDAKELKQRRSRLKRLGISENEAERLLKSEDANEGRRTRSRSRGGTTESPRAAKKIMPAKETPSKRGRKAKKATAAPAATAAEEEEEATGEESAEKAEEAKEAKEEAAEDREEAAAKEEDEEEEEEEEEAPAAEDGEQDTAAGPEKEKGSEGKTTDDGEAKTE